ncbi:MAG: hypothetical protein ACRDD1_16750, partial [Planctomycetia bacterium]
MAEQVLLAAMLLLVGAADDGAPEASDAGKRTGTILARVDNRVVLLEDVLPMVRGKLAQAKKQLPADQYKKVEWELLKQAVQVKIQREVILSELEMKVEGNKQVLERVRQSAAKDFEKFLLERGREAGLKSRADIVKQLESEGSTLADLQTDFIDNMVSQQFLMSLLRNQVKEPTREDLLRYYQDHAKDFSPEAGAEWRHIEIKKGDDPAAALRK